MREYRTRNRLALQTYRQEDKRLEQVIGVCLIEIGQNREGTIWTDPMLGELSQEYSGEGIHYWVLENEEGV